MFKFEGREKRRVGGWGGGNALQRCETRFLLVGPYEWNRRENERQCLWLKGRGGKSKLWRIGTRAAESVFGCAREMQRVRVCDWE